MMGNQPIFILSDDTSRTRGKDAKSNNIAAAKAVADAVRSTLGPKGMDKMVVDDWGQCKGGKLGSLRAHVESGKLSEESLHAELCQIVTGERPGRERDEETILFWHRGLSLSDVALGAAMLEKADRLGIGQRLRYA